MYKKIIFAALAITLVAFSSCKNSTTDSKSAKESALDYEALAQDLCACMQPLMALNAEIKTLIVGGDTEKAQALYSKIAEVAQSQEKCVLDLENKYGDINGDEQEAKATAAMEKHCPDVVNLMKETE